MLLAKSPGERSVSTWVPQHQETISPIVKGKGGRASLHLPETMGETVFIPHHGLLPTCCRLSTGNCTRAHTPAAAPPLQMCTRFFTIQTLQCFPRGNPGSKGLGDNSMVNTVWDTVRCLIGISKCTLTAKCSEKACNRKTNLTLLRISQIYPIA